MPELPDVEIFRQYFDSTSLHKKIVNVDFDSDANRILEDISVAELKSSLEGQSFRETRRHGKYFFAKLDSKNWLLLHFGMTGFFRCYKNKEEKPSHTRILIEFGNEYKLAYDNQRKLGKVNLIEDFGKYLEEKDLGPDALSEDLDWEKFKKLFSHRRGMIKSALMNQSIIAGVGNIYSDEILFQAKIHPKIKVNNLSEKKLKEIFEVMREVLQTAIDKRVDTSEFPETYIIPHRNEGEACPKCDGKIEKIKVSGRSGYYCPKCQKKP